MAVGVGVGVGAWNAINVKHLLHNGIVNVIIAKSFVHQACICNSIFIYTGS